MEYKYCHGNNFEDFASGSVIMNKAGFTNFPVRLAQEIYCRCLNYLGTPNDICLYDPCGGGGYLLTVLGFLNSQSIKTIIHSDVNDEAIYLANKNLSLLTLEGLKYRICELEKLYNLYGKHSHLQAINSANNLKILLEKSCDNLSISINKTDILDKEALTTMTFKADIVMTDIPYGNIVSWKGNQDGAVNVLLDNLVPVLKSSSVVAIISDKQQKIKSDKYMRLEKNLIGKRKFEILQLNKG